MKKVLFAIICLFCVCGARAANENAATSKEYVDTELATKQPTIPAAGNDVVMTFDSTATDGIGTKQIYDESASYATQENTLVTAATANAAVQMALNGELTCGMYDPDNPTDCWLWNLNSVPERTLPAGYTALPYLESTGTQWLDLGQPIGSGENITVKFEFTIDSNAAWFGARGATSRTPGFVFDNGGLSGHSLFIMSRNVADSSQDIGYRCPNLAFNTPYILKWYGNPLQIPVISPQTSFFNQGVTESNYIYTPTRNSCLFTYCKEAGGTGMLRIMRIYYFTVEGKMNLVPARRDSDGELGMYDTVSGNFLTNQGTGKFISGIYTNHAN